jgi:hypothetical protein
VACVGRKRREAIARRPHEGVPRGDNCYLSPPSLFRQASPAPLRTDTMLPCATTTGTLVLVLCVIAVPAVGVSHSQPSAAACSPVQQSLKPLPNRAEGWRDLLDERQPVLFRTRADDSESPLLLRATNWSWGEIGAGLGPHMQAFTGAAGQRGFPYWESNMPLETIPARRRLDRRASPFFASGSDLVAQLHPTPKAGRQLLYASQSLLRLRDGQPDKRRTGPEPPMGLQLLSAMQQLSAASNTSLAFASIWLASQGAGTPLHYDTSHNFFVQLHGRKRARLLPPSAAAKARLYPSLHPGYRQSQIDISDAALGQHLLAGVESKDSQRRAMAARALANEAMEVILSPGDVLSLPPYWLHSMEALEPSAEEEEAAARASAPADNPAAVASVAWWVTADAFVIMGKPSFLPSFCLRRALPSAPVSFLCAPGRQSYSPVLANS